MLSGGRRQADYGSRTVLRTKSSHFRGHEGAAQAQGSSQSHLSYTGLEKGSAKPPLCIGGKEGTEMWEIGNKCRESKNGRSLCKYPLPSLPLGHLKQISSSLGLSPSRDRGLKTWWGSRVQEEAAPTRRRDLACRYLPQF